MKQTYMPMSGGQAIVETLCAHGVDTVFGLPGAQMYGLFDALKQAEDQVRVISSRHEQGAAYMAFGYAQSSGRVGTYSVVPGPGVLNTTAALCTAWGCNMPLLCLTGQIPSAFMGAGRGHLHELPDQLTTLRSLLKWADIIESPAAAPAKIREAFRQMLGGRRGPVSLEMCWDHLSMAEEVALPITPIDAADLPRPAVDEDRLADAVAMLNKAKRPMIMVGGGAVHASREITELAHMLQAPVAAFRSGKGIVSEDDAYGINSVAAWRLWPDCDLLIGIGSRLEMPYMRWTGMQRLVMPADHGPPLIRIDIDEAEMRRLPAAIELVADSRDCVAALTQALHRHARSRENREAEIAAAKAKARQKIETVQPQMAYLDVIREVLPRDGLFVEELCQIGFTSYYGFPTYLPRSYITAGFQGTLGFGFPTALGAKVANPDKAVVSVIGDGGFMFAAQELSTAVDHDIGVITILFNNGAYGNVRRDQIQRFQGRVIGAEFSNPDFLKLADSFGVAAERVTSPEALRPVLARAIDRDAPMLIEVPVDPDREISPWPFILGQ